MKLSIILPIYNEEKSLPLLFEEIIASVSDYSYEIIAVNDCSRDDSLRVLKEMASNNQAIKVLSFRRNYGQTAALSAGISHASGDVIVLIDSDLENDPKDIEVLLKRLNEGYDVVSGWRRPRWKNQFLTRKLPSIMANKIISKIGGVHLHDYGCTLKVYRAEILKDVKLYGQMHRFIPIFCKWQGGKVTEVEVNYRDRMYGKSNYGLFRIYKVLLDLLLIIFLDKFLARPIHFFGGAGFLSFFASLLIFGTATYFKISGQKDFVETPLPVLGTTFLILGVLLILMGIVAEILSRTYFESQGKTPYQIREKVNVI